MAKKYDVFVALDTCVDFLLQCGDVNPQFGQKEQIIQDYTLEIGGSGCIFASQTAKLGLKTLGAGILSTDLFGSILQTKLQEAGVDFQLLRTAENVRTAVGISLCKDTGDRAILTYMGTINEMEASELPLEAMESARHIHVGSYYLMTKLQKGYADRLKRAKACGASVSLDTNWDPAERWDGGIWEILPYVDLFMPNENEILAITKKSTVTQAVKALDDIIPVIAVKQGNQGATAFYEGKSCKMPAIGDKVVDTVGAGDSFDGGFVYGYLQGYDIETCLKIGIFCGSSNVERAAGVAGQPDIDRLKRFL